MGNWPQVRTDGAWGPTAPPFWAPGLSPPVPQSWPLYYSREISYSLLETISPLNISNDFFKDTVTRIKVGQFRNLPARKFNSLYGLGILTAGFRRIVARNTMIKNNFVFRTPHSSQGPVFCFPGPKMIRCWNDCSADEFFTSILGAAQTGRC